MPRARRLRPQASRGIRARCVRRRAAARCATLVRERAALPGVLAGTPVVENVQWIPELDISLSFRLDALALILALVVTGVGALVLAYCAWYFTDAWLDS